MQPPIGQSRSDYRTEFVAVRALDDERIREMAALYLQHFDASSESLFRDDLADKDEVLLLRHGDELAGFSAVKFYERDWNGSPVRIVYSGDTIVAPAHWGQQRLAFDWITRTGRLKRESPTLPLYWFLLVKGHRTFRYLPIFSRSFFPHWQSAPPALKALADQLAGERFGADYNATTGVVEFETSRGHLRDDLALPDDGELARPAVRFFLERNPGYRRGHELVCLCELDVDNLKPLAARLFRKGLDGDA